GRFGGSRRRRRARLRGSEAWRYDDDRPVGHSQARPIPGDREMTSSAPTAPASRTGELDLLLPLRSAGTLENPYPIYSVIRTVRPVLEVPVPGYDGPGVWMLTRYRDVHAVLRDPRFSVERLRAPIV